MLSKFTGPKEVKRWKERMKAVPLNGGSTADFREFLNAKPTPCSLGSSGSFPCQKNASCSWGCCLKGIWSLAVQQRWCWASWVYNWWWLFFWSHQPVVDHCRGQDTLSWHCSLLVARIVSSFSVVSLVQDLQPACQFSLAPSNWWSRQNEVDQHLTDWELPSLKWLVADQWDCKDPSHHQRQSIAPKPMPISLDL